MTADTSEAGAARRRRPHSLTKIERDPEVRRLVDQMLPYSIYDEILAAVRDRFGPARTPSRSALSRYYVTRCHQKARR